MFSFPEEELLLFMVEGEGIVQVEKKEYFLEFYDVLYIPVGMPFRLKASPGKKGPAEAFIGQQLQKRTLLHHASGKRSVSDSKRIRQMQKKNVCPHVRCNGQANKLVAVVYDHMSRRPSLASP